MKKLFALLTAFCLMLAMAPLALARGEKTTVWEGADLVSVHRMAIGKPLYLPNPGDDKAPTNEQLTEALFAGAKVARSYIMSYDDVAKNILAAKKIDIKALETKKAAAAFKENVSGYADAYLIVTVAGQDRKTFFFDVYKAGTDAPLYTYELQANRSDTNDIKTYTFFAEQFYKRFEKSAEDQLKAEAKGKKK